MYYEFNVALNGQHFFATAERSVQHLEKAKAVLAALESKFPKSEGYEVTVRYWEHIGRSIDPETLRAMTVSAHDLA